MARSGSFSVVILAEVPDVRFAQPTRLWHSAVTGPRPLVGAGQKASRDTTGLVDDEGFRVFESISCYLFVG